MSTPSQNSAGGGPVMAKPETPRSAAKPRSVQKCNFRMAGRLSNEYARALTSTHEEFIQRIISALERHLGATPEVKLGTLDQATVKDHVARTPALSYIVPFSAGMLTVEFDNDLVFPIIELLMGGMIDERSTSRDLSEIEEEIMQDIVLLIVRQVEPVWAIPDLSLTPGARIKASTMFQSFRPTERLTVLRFDVTIGTVAGGFNLVLSPALFDSLLKKIKEDRPQKKAKVWNFLMPPLRERILDCELEVIAELPGLKVAVRDLVTLQPGSVLKLRAPIRIPGMLTAAGRGLFEAVPVRSGSHRAAQLGRRAHSKDWKRR